MDYYVLIPSLLIGLVFGRYILNRFDKPNELVWFIILTFFGINILIIIFERYILPNTVLIDQIKAYVPGVLIGVYLYLILAVFGVFKPSRIQLSKKHLKK